MANDNYNIHIDVKGNVFVEINKLKQQFVTLNEKVDKIGDSSEKSMSKLQKAVKNVSFSSITQQFSNLSQTLNEVATPGLKFNKSMNELQALTGVTGSKLKAIENDAKDLAKTYGGSAAQGVDSFKMILSQLGPELANTPEALKEMGDAVMITSKLMGGDQLAATEVLTAAMNQFDVSMDDPIEAVKTMKDMMNVMAKAAAEGSSELPNIKLAIENAGIAAKSANVSFEETNAAIQVLDKAGKRGAEGGIALRNVMSTLAKGRFLPKDVQDELAAAGVNIQDLTNKNLSLSERLATLQPVLNDTALLTKTFGQANASAAQALISQTDEIDRYTEAITGTKNAEEQVAIIMESHEERLARVQAKIEGYKISLFDLTDGAIAYLQPASEMLRQVSSLTPAFDLARSGVKLFSEVLKKSSLVTKLVTAAQWAWNAAMMANPIGLVIGAVAALSAGVYVLSKALREGTAEQEAFNKVQKQASEFAREEMAEISMLTSKIRSSKAMRKEAIDELVAKYPYLLEKYKDEEDILNNINEIEKELSDNAMERAEKRARAKVMEDNFVEIQRLKTEPTTYWEETKAAWHSWKAFWGDVEDQREAAFEIRDNKIDKLMAQNHAIMEEEERLIQEANKKALESTDAYVMATANKFNIFQQTADAIRDGTFFKDEHLGVLEDNSSNKTETKNISDSKIEKRNINVRIDKLVDVLNINTSNIKESATEIKGLVEEALIGAVRDFEIAL